MEDLNDLENLEEDLINKKKEKQAKSPMKKNPFAKKTKMDFKFSLKSAVQLKQIDFKKDILSKINIISFLWVLLILT